MPSIDMVPTFEHLPIDADGASCMLANRLKLRNTSYISCTEECQERTVSLRDNCLMMFRLIDLPKGSSAADHVLGTESIPGCIWEW